VYATAWAIPLGSKNIDAAKAFISYMMQTKVDAAFGVGYGALPSLTSVAMQNVYGYSAEEAAKHALVPFSQPAIVTVPLGFLTLVVVSLLTRRRGLQPTAS
jgi:cation/acetate symporter